MSNEVYDVAIIGGGVAGIYTGWRLLQDNLAQSETLKPLAAKRGGKLRVAIFEGSHRLGGRLYSIEPPDMPDVRAEIGGMRFLTTQRLVANLVSSLNLPIHDFPVSQPGNIYHLRGKHFRDQDFNEPDKIPYNLSWHERGKTPGQLIADAIEQVIPGALSLNEAQWKQVKKTAQFQGEPLYNQGFWNVLLQVMSSEAYQMALDAGGYFTPFNNWNAADAMHFFAADFSPNAKFQAVTGGYEKVPATLAQQFVAAGGETHLHKPLAGFEQTNSQTIQLSFQDGSIAASYHLVLAMPRRSLELLDQENEFFQTPALQSLIPTVTPQPMFKIFLCYRYPWWEQLGVKQGKSNTDLPIRQTYYFAISSESSKPANPNYRNALLMASYDDGRYVSYWEGLQEEHWRQKQREMVNAGISAWECHSCPPAMTEEVQRQLQLMHDIETMPEPYAAVFKDWREDPFGGAWNSWNIRVKSWEVMEKMLQPLPDWPVYIVGEAYSQQQGWVEGSLQTAEEMLQEKLDLQRPDWLSWN